MKKELDAAELVRRLTAENAKLAAEIERLQAAKRAALAIADERSKENVGLRAENVRLNAALRKVERQHAASNPVEE